MQMIATMRPASPAITQYVTQGAAPAVEPAK